MQKVKYILSIAVILFILTAVQAQPSYQWVKTAIGNSGVQARDIVTDQLGNVYALGSFDGTVDFDPGAGTFNMSTFGSLDIFIQKLDPNGNFLWAIQMGGSGQDLSRRLVIDPSGNICLTGYFYNTASFGSFNLSSSGGGDIFVAKINPSGTFLWAKRIGGSASLGDGGWDIDVNGSGDIAISGWFSGTVDFNPGSGTYNLSSNSSSQDAFILKLDGSGNFIWAHGFGSSGSDATTGVEFDQTGNIFTCGYTDANLDLDPTGGVDNETPNGRDPFIQKFDASGNYQWGHLLTGSGTDNALGNVVDALGNIYTMGWFNFGMDFDPGTNNTNDNSAGSFDIYISKLDPSGNYVDRFIVGAASTEIAEDIAIDSGDNLYLTGRFATSVDFDPGPGTQVLTPVNQEDIFILQLSSTGVFGWVSQIGTSLDGSGGAITVDVNNDVYSTGYWTGTADFDPGTGTDNQNANINGSHYVHKMGQCLSTSSTINPSACTSYTSPSGKIFTTTNTYLDTIQNVGGCDSTITINLTINNATNGTDVQVACGSYTWALNSMTYTNSTSTPTHTIVGGNANGCDSIVTLNLTINNATTGTDVQTACGTYTWIDNNIYTASNTTATHTLVGGNAAGCDSVVTLNLTINNADTSVTKAAPMLTANTSGATYRWLDCDNLFAVIPGETAQSFTATTNGNYAVEVTENGCTDTSSCYSITGIGIDELSSQELITIYPNPTNGVVSIENISNQETNLLIINAVGKIIAKKSFKSKLELNLTEQAKGIYYLKLTTGNHTFVKKLVIR